MLRARVTAFALLLLVVGATPAQVRGQPQPAQRFPHAELTEALTRAVTIDAELERLYGPHPISPLWIAEDGAPSNTGRDALRLLDLASSDGLDPADYQTDLLHHLFDAAAESSATGPVDAATIVRFDVALSRAVLSYLRDLRDGRIDPRAVGFVEFESVSARSDLVEALRDAIATRQVIALATASRPRYAEYEALRIALARFRELAGREPAPLPISVNASVHPGDAFAGLAALRGRLVAVGALDSTRDSGAGGRYEGAVVDAVKRFQRQHTLEPDGVIGKRTVAELMVPLSRRVAQLELAMERLRWLPRQRPERLVLVNIAAFRLAAFESGSEAVLPAFSSRVIVGQAKKTETPIVSATLTEIQFRPYWNVPRSIVRNEILPALARQPDYLERQHMELVAGDRDDSPVVAASPKNLERLATGALRVRQRPGPANSLGLIKFSFPNPHDVYMHATPARGLFARDRRDFSHGCIRVDDTTGLAAWALAPQGGWDRGRIVAAMDAATASRVALASPVRVLLFYATATLRPDSSDIAFAEDIYGLDARLTEALAQRPNALLPGANAAGVDVHEIGGRIEPDSASLSRERSGSEFRERNIGQANIDSLPLHVKTAGRHPFRATA